jgi:cell division transport system permease protein
MDEGVRLLFKRALDGEPAVPASEMAREARVVGRRLRRWRGVAVGAAAGVIAVLAGVMAVALTPQPAGDTTPPVPRPVAMMMADPACTFPAYDDATDAVIFLRMDITDRQRRDLDATVRSDRRVRGVQFESGQQAYARFKRIYADVPALVGAVKVDQVPDSFLVTLAEPSAYAGFLAQFSKAGGVDEIVGYRCPDGLSKGEGR